VNFFAACSQLSAGADEREADSGDLWIDRRVHAANKRMSIIGSAERLILSLRTENEAPGYSA
jgi:hypothetical protein